MTLSSDRTQMRIRLLKKGREDAKSGYCVTGLIAYITRNALTQIGVVKCVLSFPKKMDARIIGGETMDDNISRQGAKDYIRNQCMASDMPEEWVNGVMWAVSELNRVPSADRPPGKWIFKPLFPNDESEFPMGHLECSVCGSHHSNRTPCNFCDNCGADMRGKKDE